MTVRTLTAPAARHLHVFLGAGRVVVTTDPAATEVRVRIRSVRDTGPDAEAVEQALLMERDGTVQVDIRNARARTVDEPVRAHTRGGSVFNFHGGVNNTVFYDTVETMEIGSGGIRVDGNVTGAVVTMGTIASSEDQGVAVEVEMPAGGNVLANLGAADLGVHGALNSLTSTTGAGSVRVGSVEVARVTVVSGQVTLARVGELMQVSTTSGAVTVNCYEGHDDSRVSAISGAITVGVLPTASGSLDLETVTGAITTTGARHLRLAASTTIGHVHHG
ncbi:hypothetical protein [Kitasatospora griseola]|uniref:hypothetical protein n=1 Tax=Kitasatospora griseola TaxID=2064 RepID=UPI00343B86E8